MPSFPGAAVAVAIIAVAFVLVLGLVNLLRSGSANRSQQLMRWRVGLQFLAILVIVAALLWRRMHG
jgi:cyanate permease